MKEVAGSGARSEGSEKSEERDDEEGRDYDDDTDSKCN
jgi:hypothetical protein